MTPGLVLPATGTLVLVTGIVLAADEPGPDQPEPPIRLKKEEHAQQDRAGQTRSR